MTANLLAQLSDTVQTEIRRCCEAAYPLEACGVLLGRGDGEREPWTVTRVRPAPNQHGEDRRRRYLVEPEFQARAERDAQQAGEDVLGYFHSHPDHPALPSEYDRQHAWQGYLYVICSVVRAHAADLNAFALNQQGGEFRRVRVEPIAASDQPTSEVP